MHPPQRRYLCLRFRSSVQIPEEAPLSPLSRSELRSQRFEVRTLVRAWMAVQSALRAKEHQMSGRRTVSPSALMHGWRYTSWTRWIDGVSLAIGSFVRGIFQDCSKKKRRPHVLQRGAERAGVSGCKSGPVVSSGMLFGDPGSAGSTIRVRVRARLHSTPCTIQTHDTDREISKAAILSSINLRIPLSISTTLYHC